MHLAKSADSVVKQQFFLLFQLAIRYAYCIPIIGIFASVEFCNSTLVTAIGVARIFFGEVHFFPKKADDVFSRYSQFKAG